MASPPDTSSLLLSDLSSGTLAALQEFLGKQAKGHGSKNVDLDLDQVQGLDQKQEEDEEELFRENWGLSQFWYDEQTCKRVAEEVMARSDGGKTGIACVSCPSLFRELRKNHKVEHLHLFEYDKRFAVFGNQFSLYDYYHPLDIPSHLHHSFGVVVADPPYLSEECFVKTAQTMKLLARDSTSSTSSTFSTSSTSFTSSISKSNNSSISSSASCSFVVLTGAVQREHVFRYIQARACRFKPQHRNKLGNEFCIYTNYEPSDNLGGWEDENDQLQPVRTN
ncbi:hypothetical protein CBR_g551 [Chara braunii]|uniref:Protein-lysine N-methyltransferase CBR_g551 n=1 Tax=Chara braunii TaxID=69332 RepID=A0A388KBN2_CHABU|nr:hypothetical protein CBR_g551 [Chara braunii]|eukprot:GBG67416.1 hypothetical protein CBR_g551 [Chara braunii]